MLATGREASCCPGPETGDVQFALDSPRGPASRSGSPELTSGIITPCRSPVYHEGGHHVRNAFPGTAAFTGTRTREAQGYVPRAGSADLRDLPDLKAFSAEALSRTCSGWSPPSPQENSRQSLTAPARFAGSRKRAPVRLQQPSGCRGGLVGEMHFDNQEMRRAMKQVAW